MSLPLWSRTSSATDYGGHPQKRDYGDTGCINALTDVSAAQVKRLASDAASVARTLPLWIAKLSRSGSVITVNFSRPLWATARGSYVGSSAPTGHPSATLTGTNEVTITFPASATDEYGTEGDIAPLAAFPEGAASLTYSIPSTSTLVVDGFTDGLSVNLVVW